MSYDITTILNEPCLHQNRMYLKTLLTDINGEAADEISLAFAEATINEPIKLKLAAKKTESWLNLCKKIINPLISCSFDKRPDYDDIQVLPFCCKIDEFKGQAYGVNIYDATTRILTIFYTDTSREGNSTLYATRTSEPIVCGNWSADIKAAIKTINDTGLQLINARQSSTQTTHAPSSVLNTYYRGNTITVIDLVEYINRIKKLYDKTDSI